MGFPSLWSSKESGARLSSAKRKLDVSARAAGPGEIGCMVQRPFCVGSPKTDVVVFLFHGHCTGTERASSVFANQWYIQSMVKLAHGGGALFFAANHLFEPLHILGD